MPAGRYATSYEDGLTSPNVGVVPNAADDIDSLTTLCPNHR